MKKTLLDAILMFTRYFFIGFLAQFIVLSTLFGKNSTAQLNETVAGNFQGATVKTLFALINEKTALTFIYDSRDINEDAVVHFRDKSLTVGSMLDSLSKKLDWSFKKIGNTITVKKNKHAPKANKFDLLHLPVEQPNSTDLSIIPKMIPPERQLKIFVREDIQVTGLVTDSSGSPLPGVTVYVKNSKGIGTATDLNGRYVLVVPDNATLVFNMIGFDSQEVRIASQRVINIRLVPSTSKLQETVVVAFGTQKKEDVVGSVTTINPSELKVPSSNLTTALAGRLAGVIAYQRSGEPGADNADFFIRGVTTFGYKKDPLILVDGIELSADDLARMQVDDIASFSILKDATATALYGARGANGVILITTKEGTEGRAKVSVRIENSMSAPTKNVQLADPVTYMKLNNEAVLTRNPLGVLPYSRQQIDNTIAGTNPYVYPTTDWQQLLFKKHTMNQRANLNVSGGGRVARYYLAATFNQDNGIMKVDHRNNFNNNIDLKTYELRSNVNINITKTTEVGIKLYGTFNDYTGPIGGGTNFYHEAIESDPASFPPYFPADSVHRFVNHILFGNTPAMMLNPYADMVKGYEQYNKNLMLAQFDLKQDLSFITEGLNLQGLFNTTRYSYFDVTRAYTPYFYEVGYYDKTGGSYTLNPLNEESGTEYLDYHEEGKQVKTTTYIQAMANYHRTFNDKHGISGLLVFLIQNQVDGNAGSVQASLPHRNLGVSGRFTYACNNRYFAEFDFGYNGSESFDENHRWGFFPSAGLAWQVSNEKFWKPLSHTITNFKLRGTYGLIGNDAIGDPSDRFFYLSDVNLNSSGKGASFGLNYDYHNNGVVVNRYSDPNITWETSYKGNVGADIELFHHMNITVDLWKEKRTHILMDRAFIPTTFGLPNTAIPQANVGQAEGKGVDLSLDYSQFFSNSFWIQARANFTYAVSRFLVYEEPDYQNMPWLSHVGKPIDQQWGYLAERLFVDDKEVLASPSQNFGERPMGGDLKYRDVNKDGQITTLDEVPIGYPTSPEIVYGFGASAGYKNFDISCFFQGLARESFWIDVKATTPFATGTINKLQSKNQLLKAYTDDHWSEDNQDLYALWPRLSTSVNPNNSQANTWFMRNGTFLRLKSAELGYTLPRRLTERIHVDKTRIYLSGINLLSWSYFKLWDVEMAGNGLGYPIQRVINIGAQVSF